MAIVQIKGDYAAPPDPPLGTGQRISIRVAGPVKSGKSTIIRALVKAIPENLNAVVTIEEVTTAKEGHSG